MGVPQTLPADFQGWDKAAAPPATLPADFNQWDQPSSPPSAASRLGTNFLSGLGVTSNEGAKNFFVHPLDTVVKSLEAQGELAKKARDAYDRGDYMGALQHALNYMVPFVGQQADQAGEQLKSGDIAGGVGRTLGVAAPLVVGSPEARAAAADAASASAEKAVAAGRAAYPYAAPAGSAIWKTLDVASFNRIGKIWDAWKNLPDEIKAKAPQFTDPGAPFPEEPPAALLQARGLARGAQPPAPSPASALETVPVNQGEILKQRLLGNQPAASALDRLGNAPLPEAQPDYVPARPSIERIAPGQAGSMAESVAAPATPEPLSQVNGQTIPRTLSGDSALRQVLTGQDNATLLKIARSRGINVTREAQLKPGAADNLIVNKIIDDFSPEELQEVGAQFLENTRFRHAFGDIGPEAWKTMSLQTYFPEVKIPAAQLIRTRAAITNAPLQNPQPQTGAVTDLATTLKQNARQAAKATKGAAPAPLEDLTDVLQQSLARIKQSSGAQ